MTFFFQNKGSDCPFCGIVDKIQNQTPSVPLVDVRVPVRPSAVHEALIQSLSTIHLKPLRMHSRQQRLPAAFIGKFNCWNVRKPHRNATIRDRLQSKSSSNGEFPPPLHCCVLCALWPWKEGAHHHHHHHHELYLLTSEKLVCVFFSLFIRQMETDVVGTPPCRTDLKIGRDNRRVTANLHEKQSERDTRRD